MCAVCVCAPDLTTTSTNLPVSVLSVCVLSVCVYDPDLPTTSTNLPVCVCVCVCVYVCVCMWGLWLGVPMSHVNYKKSYCPPVEFKKRLCHPVDFRKRLCRISLRPKNGRVALSILGVCVCMHVCLCVCLCVHVHVHMCVCLHPHSPTAPTYFTLPLHPPTLHPHTLPTILALDGLRNV